MRLAEGLANLWMWFAQGIRLPLGLWLRLWRLGAMRANADRVPFSTQFDGPVRAFGTGSLRIGEHCRFGRDLHFDTAEKGQIRLGDRVRVNTGGVIVATVGISIGDDSLIGEYVTIRDADHGVAVGTLIRLQPFAAKEISIGRDVWIGRGCCILKGVCIGDGAVIGANSVVTRDVPENSIFAGAPAKSIGLRKL